MPDSPGYCSIGLHPWDVNENFKDAIAKIRALAADSQVLAIGEAGFDKLHGPDRSLQSAAFEAQAKAAEELRKPLIIHCVRSYNEMIEMHKKLAVCGKWIVHDFTGSDQLAKSLVKRGIYLSFGSSLMKKHRKTMEAFANAPTEYIFLETDDNPELLIETIYAKAAIIRDMAIEKLQHALRNNFQYVFLNH